MADQDSTHDRWPSGRPDPGDAYEMEELPISFILRAWAGPPARELGMNAAAQIHAARAESEVLALIQEQKVAPEGMERLAELNTRCFLGQFEPMVQFFDGPRLLPQIPGLLREYSDFFEERGLSTDFFEEYGIVPYSESEWRPTETP